MPKPNPREILRQQLYKIMHGGKGMTWAAQKTGIQIARLMNFVGSNPATGFNNESLSDTEVQALLDMDLLAQHANARPTMHDEQSE